MKTKISIGLNVLLIGVIGILVFSHKLDSHYYAEYTRMLLRKAATQIEAGNSTKVRDVLITIRGMPTRGDLFSLMKQLDPSEPQQPPIRE